jgi:hypothetical protein
VTTTAQLAAQLRAMIADPDCHIERRAAEIAAPEIATAQAAADARIAEAQFELQRTDDLIGELRKRLAMQDRHLADYMKARREALRTGEPVTIRG